MKTCPFCQQVNVLWSVHHKQCKHIQGFKSFSGTYLRFNDKCYCIKCQKQIEAKDQIKHGKTAHKSKKRTISHKPYSMDNRSIGSSYFGETQQFPSSTTKTEDHLSNLQKIAQGWTGQALYDWLPKTMHLSYQVRLNLFRIALQTGFVELRNNIPRLNINQLNQIGGSQIRQILKKQEDVFDVDIVVKKLEGKNITQHRKKRLYQFLNHFLAECKFIRRYPTNVKPQKQKINYIFFFKQLAGIVTRLFNSQNQVKIGFALDLLIIYHCGQRFPSSISLVQDSVKQMMKNGSTYMKIKQSTKTKAGSYIILNQQLIKLLKRFKWKKFTFNKNMLSRISTYCNFSIKSLRKGMFSQQVAIINAQRSAGKLSDHKSNKVAVSFYSSDGIIELRVKFHESLNVPKSEKQYNLIQKHEAYTMIKVNPQIKESLFQTHPDNKIFIEWDKYFQPQFQAPTKFNPNGKQQDEQSQNQIVQEIIEQNQNNKNNQQEVVQEKAVYQDFTIKTRSYQRINYLFDLKLHFYRRQGSWQCLFCHQIIFEERLFCQCSKFFKRKGKIIIKSAKINKSEENILMPVAYLENNVHLFNQVRFFIHARGGHMTNVAYLEENIQIDQYQGQQSFQLKDFQKYQNGTYFPPLMIKSSGFKNQEGTGVGIFAAQAILKDTLIGQYGGDVARFHQTIEAKRWDMIMTLKMKSKLQIMNRTRSSYIQLLNSSKNGNCIQVKCIINGRLAILIKTTRNVKRYQQLTYNYKGEFSFSKNLLTVQQKQQSQEDNSSQIQEDEQFKAKNPQTLKKQKFPQSSQPSTKLTKPQKKESINQELEQIVEASTPKKKVKIQNKNKIKNKDIEFAINMDKSINDCYAFCIIFLFRYYKNQITSIDDVSSQLLKVKCRTQKLIKNFFTDIKQQKQQQDVTEFYSMLKNALFRNSPITNFVQRHNIKCPCNAQVIELQDSEIYFLYNKSQFTEFPINAIDDNLCSQCKQILTKNQRSQILSNPKRILISLNRMTNEGKKLEYDFNYQNNIIINKQQYQLKFIISHEGQKAHYGHYKVHCLKQDITIGSQSSEIIKKQVCCLVYQIIPNFTPIIFTSNMVVKGLDTVFFQIASVSKLLLAHALFNFDILKKNKKIQTFSLNIQSSISTTLQKNEDMYTLLQRMLVVSCCNSAYTLKKYAQTCMGITIQDWIKAWLINNQIGNTHISDVVGLETNISTVNDLISILKLIRRNELMQILSKSGIIVYSNLFQSSNRSSTYIGKTGTTKNNLKIFVGYNKKDFENIIVAANYPNDQAIWNEIQKY